jgi:hypothetical protein
MSQYFIISDSRLPQPGGPGPRSYIPQGEGGPVPGSQLQVNVQALFLYLASG